MVGLARKSANMFVTETEFSRKGLLLVAAIDIS